MSMDPSKWISFEELPDTARERIEIVYPYLKVNQCMFQAKESGVFVKQGNSVKIEKLLDPARENARLAATTATTTTTTARAKK